VRGKVRIVVEQSSESIADNLDAEEHLIRRLIRYTELLVSFIVENCITLVVGMIEISFEEKYNVHISRITLKV
jgi:hypothetical protein